MDAAVIAVGKAISPHWNSISRAKTLMAELVLDAIKKRVSQGDRSSVELFIESILISTATAF